jgi:glycosyltransferase involved in cell wall biosynthesis
MRFARHPHIAARRAALVMCSNVFNQQAFSRATGIAPQVVPGNGIARLLGQAPRSETAPLRLLWVGRLEALKALPLVLEALAQLPREVNYELRVMGQGPRLAAWQRLAERLGIADRVNWISRHVMEEVYDEYRNSDLFVFTSMRETVPTVIIEALAAGLPIVYLDHQGIGEMVPAQCGVGVPVQTPRQVVADLTRAIAELAEDRATRKEMGEAALAYAEKYLWDRQGDEINRLLWQVFEERGGPSHDREVSAASSDAER